MSGSGVRPAIAADRVAVAAMLGRAFADDPAFAYIFPDATDRADRLRRFFALAFDTDHLDGMRLITLGCEATTLWRGPGRPEATPWQMLARAWPIWRAFGGSLGRALRVSHAIAAHFPAEPFWYLHMAGCDPAAQCRGFGTAAVRGGLERVSGGGLPVYLETANERNLGFYRALGFVVVQDWSVGIDGPRFWSLRRG